MLRALRVMPILWLLLFAIVAQARAMTPPSVPGVDAPELAKLGSHAVGVSTLTLVDKNQLDLMAFDSTTNTAPRHDRELQVVLWYPAMPSTVAKPETYVDSLASEPPTPPTRFQIPGIAVHDAAPEPGRFPLVVVAHGYGNVPVAMSWLTENLASKGYVVAAIRHNDDYLNPASLPNSLLRRPLDIAFVARELQARLGREGRIDATRSALIGYSQGGYGVLTSGGAVLDPAGPMAQRFPGGLLAPYTRGGAAAADLLAPHVRAIVAIAPAGGTYGSWSAEGLKGIHAPLLLIAGDRDQTLDYKTNAHAFFELATNSNRYLLTYLNGGHALGLGTAPDEMRQNVWNLDWFEDPVWRKDRLVGVSLHFITAFLDRYVKDDASKAAYLDGLVVNGEEGIWQAPANTPWGAQSPGGGGITLWKGFARRHAEGLTFMHREADAAK
jgi:predicted dienelactone hydrolase